jgi:pimeloyl-ACP methyl ester carboxylesterase
MTAPPKPRRPRNRLHLRSAGAFVRAGLALAVSSCGGGGGEPLRSVATFTETPCDLDEAGLELDRLRCGFVTVPEDRDDPKGRTIELAVAVARATTDAPAPDPVVVLSGGPGDAALDSFLPFLQRVEAVSTLQRRRDVVVFDQRGTGRSRPLLDCPEVEAASRESLTRVQPAREDTRDTVAALRACHERLLARGDDLAAYTSAASARDIRDVMTALGYREWNLYGNSYGSRLAQTAMRDAPAGIRSVILDSVVPVQGDTISEWGRNLERSLTTLLDTCAGDPRCHAAFPDLENTLFDLVRQLDAEPLIVSAEDPDTGEEITVVVTGERLLIGLQSALYDAELIPVLPLVISLTAAGNTGLLAAAAADVLSGPLNAEGMGMSVECSEEAPFITPDLLAQGAAGVHVEIQAIADDFIVRETLDVCSFWEAASPPSDENDPVSSPIPTLVLAGQLDPITPPRYGLDVAGRLSQAQYFEFAGFGHAVLGTASAESARPRCAVQIVEAFLTDPTAPVDGGCTAALPAIEFAGS